MENNMKSYVRNVQNICKVAIASIEKELDAIEEEYQEEKIKPISKIAFRDYAEHKKIINALERKKALKQKAKSEYESIIFLTNSFIFPEDRFELDSEIIKQISIVGSLLPDIQPTLSNLVKNAIRNINNESAQQYDLQAQQLEQLLLSRNFVSISNGGDSISPHQFVNGLKVQAKNNLLSSDLSFDFNFQQTNSDFAKIQRTVELIQQYSSDFDRSDKKTVQLLAGFPLYAKNAEKIAARTQALEQIGILIQLFQNENIPEFQKVVSYLKELSAGLDKELKVLMREVQNYDIDYLNGKINEISEKKKAEEEEKRAYNYFIQEYSKYLESRESYLQGQISPEEFREIEKNMQELENTINLDKHRIIDAKRDAEAGFKSKIVPERNPHEGVFVEQKPVYTTDDPIEQQRNDNQMKEYLNYRARALEGAPVMSFEEFVREQRTKEAEEEITAKTIVETSQAPITITPFEEAVHKKYERYCLNQSSSMYAAPLMTYEEFRASIIANSDEDTLEDMGYDPKQDAAGASHK